ncbi:Alkyl hydroperoxide reductase subunit AhpC (peroxiredoxin) [Chitinophaga niabensis]|uniref:Alkyl hydroperoxide reductase subunit AhpC (Peroxiredoxin) n=2 Tax=Chitinophaga niabensis TaxID=536979 RepID=A0A1N6KAR9_9BACT|nr:Alkyl hydroperoxide reductase subunit AhpC (peroxiredoxin) [Chitinophaga niabensis]
MAQDNNSLSEKMEMPEVGKPMPDFTLDSIENFKTNKVSLQDLKGQWLILDFWFLGCPSCISSFPKMNEIQNKLSDKLQIVLLAAVNDDKGEWHRSETTKIFYRKLRNKQDLSSLPIIYDFKLYKDWSIMAMPHLIIIDPDGIVRAITDGRDLTFEKLTALFKGNEVSFFPVRSDRQEFLGTNNKMENQNVIFNSILTKYSQEEFSNYTIDYQLNDSNYKRKGYTSSGSLLYQLYNIAYIGYGDWGRDNKVLYDNYYKFPILNIKDKVPFTNVESPKFWFNYSFFVPAWMESKGNIMKFMQRDLKNYFGYNVRLEEREMDVLALIANEGAAELLRNKDGKFYSDAGEGYFVATAGFKKRNFDARHLIYYLGNNLKETILTPFYDESGLEGKIDISIDALMTDLNQVRIELQKYKLDIVQKKRRMKVLVISE